MVEGLHRVPYRDSARIRRYPYTVPERKPIRVLEAPFHLH